MHVLSLLGPGEAIQQDNQLASGGDDLVDERNYEDDNNLIKCIVCV